MKKLIFLCLFGAISGLISPMDDYLADREILLAQELELSLGWGLSLSPEEEVMNELLTMEKDKEMDLSFNNARFPPSASFLETKPAYENSTVFQMLKTLPKGGILHIHDISMTSIDWLIKNATYRPNLFVRTVDDKTDFRFMSSAESEEWQSVAFLRERLGAPQYDQYLRRLLTMELDANERYETINDVWNQFTSCLGTAFGIIAYKPVWRDYYEQALKELLDDGVQYVEVRSTLPPVYDLDGSSLNPLEVALVYKEVSDKFAEENSEWCGAKLIYAPTRHASESTIEQDLENALLLKQEIPEFFAGFDLVSQEDKGFPLIDFLGPLLEAGEDIDFFFHAGETDWDWSSTDLNLVDAMLLNTSRIGHGYAIDKHPQLMEMARLKDIPIEVCPISNQVLGLVADIRNHPASSLVKSSFPLVISSDDPPVWGALPMSHDFYAAFLAIGGDSADLRFLKQLILNSFHYSKMGTVEKTTCTAKFENKWKKSIKRILYNYYPSLSIW